MMELDHLLGEVQQAQSLADLTALLQRVIAKFGFQSFNHLDTGRPDAARPFFHGTCPVAWQRCYEDNGFINGDAMVSEARRRRLPFIWGDVELPVRRTGPAPLALQAMDAAYDHGYREGYVLPFHTVDQLGRPRSALTVLFWAEPRPEFAAMMVRYRHELHVFMFYWQERAVNFVWPDPALGFKVLDSDGLPLQGARLTDRERDVLSWIARGKTTRAVAAILDISTETVESHVRASMVKLGASNRTAAAVRAVQLRLIDP